MALTYHLADAASPVRQYLEERFPIIDFSKKGSPFAEPIQKFLGVTDMPRKAVLESPAPPAFASLIGTAFDYRARYYFETFATEQTVANEGASRLGRAAHLWREFVELHEAALRRIEPLRNRLTPENETTLAQHCIILALYEQIFRAGLGIQSPLLTLGAKSKIKDLLALARVDCVEDLCQLSLAFEEDAKPLFGMSVIVNPVFDGSVAIGGADADIIFGDTLCEFKTLKAPSPTDLRKAMYQLLGYTLLDSSDEFKIRNIGVYFTRQRAMWNMPVRMFFISPMEAITFLGKGGEPSEESISTSLTVARLEFASIVAQFG